MVYNAGLKIRELYRVNNDYSMYKELGNVTSISGFKRALAEANQTQSYRKYETNNTKEVYRNTNTDNRVRLTKSMNLLEFKYALLKAQNM